MRSPLTKRLLSLAVMLLFVAGTSYHHLCSAGFVDCPPCGEFAEHGSDESEPCKSCGESAELAKVAQPNKTSDLQADFAQVAQTIIAYLVFSVPEDTVPAEVAWTEEELPLASILRDIKRSIPIRGPSTLA